LVPGRFLGEGGEAVVYETIVHGTKLAWKRTWRKRKRNTDVRAEVEILKRLSHPHLVRLIGSYMQNRCLGMLLYPMAVCDLQRFFDDAEAYWTGKAAISNTTRLEQLGYFSKSSHQHKAWPVYTRIGCLISAIAYLHSQKIQIRHKDLKPSNILLLEDSLCLSDFGHATDFSQLPRSETDRGGGTFRYKSPEVRYPVETLLQTN
jgi:serine/threonine protein kinase